MARVKGAVAKGVDNKVVREFLWAYGSLTTQPPLVENCIRGAKGQEAESHRYSTERIFSILTQLEYIDTETVFSQMKAYNQANLNENIPSVRNVQRMTKVLRCASQSIMFHMNTLDKNQKNESNTQMISAPVLDLSDEVRVRLRFLVNAGQWNAVSDILKSCEIKVREFRCPESGFSSTMKKTHLQTMAERINDISVSYYRCAA